MKNTLIEIEEFRAFTLSGDYDLVILGSNNLRFSKFVGNEEWHLFEVNCTNRHVAETAYDYFVEEFANGNPVIRLHTRATQLAVLWDISMEAGPAILSLHDDTNRVVSGWRSMPFANFLTESGAYTADAAAILKFYKAQVDEASTPTK